MSTPASSSTAVDYTVDAPNPLSSEEVTSLHNKFAAAYHELTQLKEAFLAATTGPDRRSCAEAGIKAVVCCHTCLCT